MIIRTITNTKNSIAKICIVGSLHGNELIGKKVIESLKKENIPNKINVTGIIANTEAIKKNKRFLDVDGNRCFPGIKSGNNEEKIAYKIMQIIKNYDYVIDIHSTYAVQSDIIIITKPESIQLAKQIPIKKVVLMNKKVASGHSLIDYAKLGVSIEFNKSRSSNEVIKIITRTLATILDAKVQHNKEIYKVIGFLKNRKNNYKIANFKEMKNKKINNKFYKNKLYSLFIDAKAYNGFYMIAEKIQ